MLEQKAWAASPRLEQNAVTSPEIDRQPNLSQVKSFGYPLSAALTVISSGGWLFGGTRKLFRGVGHFAKQPRRPPEQKVLRETAQKLASPRPP